MSIHSNHAAVVFPICDFCMILQSGNVQQFHQWAWTHPTWMQQARLWEACWKLGSHNIHDYLQQVWIPRLSTAVIRDQGGEWIRGAKSMPWMLHSLTVHHTSFFQWYRQWPCLPHLQSLSCVLQHHGFTSNGSYVRFFQILPTWAPQLQRCHVKGTEVLPMEIDPSYLSTNNPVCSHLTHLQCDPGVIILPDDNIHALSYLRCFCSTLQHCFPHLEKIRLHMSTLTLQCKRSLVNLLLLFPDLHSVSFKLRDIPSIGLFETFVQELLHHPSVRRLSCCFTDHAEGHEQLRRIILSSPANQLTHFSCPPMYMADDWSFFHSLQSIHLTCQTLLSEDFVAISNSCPSLTAVNVSNCISLDHDDGFFDLIQSHPQLRRVNVSYTSFACSRFLRQLASNSEIELTHLRAYTYQDEKYPIAPLEWLAFLQSKAGQSLHTVAWTDPSDDHGSTVKEWTQVYRWVAEHSQIQHIKSSTNYQHQFQRAAWLSHSPSLRSTNIGSPPFLGLVTSCNRARAQLWSRICFLLAWMRANQNNPLMDSGLDFVRAQFWKPQQELYLMMAWS